MTELFDKKDVFTVLNAEDAQQYVGTSGYFGHTVSNLQERVENGFTCVLEKADKEATPPFMTAYKNRFSLFLPADKVKKGEKMWRPFTLDEFNKIFKIGHVIIFRSKDSDYHGTWLYTGWAGGNGGSQSRSYLYLGAHNFKLPELFNGYEYSDVVRGWCPFGVEVEE